MSTPFRLFLVGGMLLCATACAPKTTWHHPKKSDGAFAADLDECRNISEAAALHTSITGKHPELEGYYEALELCLAGKGWIVSRQDSASESTQVAVPRPFFEGAAMHGFGLAIPVPREISLREQPETSAGTLHQQLWAGTSPEDESLHLAFQTTSTSMELADYPIQKPFFIYSRRPARSRTSPAWTSFAGRYDNAWVGGMGVYRLFEDPTRRIITVITWPLPEPDGPPPAGLRLSRNQKMAMDGAIEKWSGWLQSWQEGQLL